MNRLPRRRLLLLLVSWGVLLTASDRCRMFAADGQTYLISISADSYPSLGDAHELKYCTNDAREVVLRLRDHNRVVSDERILEISPDALDASLLPTRQNIVSRLPEFLSRVSNSDTVIVFVALHGARVSNRTTNRLEGYLLPPDLDPRRVPDTLISLAWLRETLQETKAGTVVLFLDACHSGTIGDTTTNNLAALSTRDVADVFGPKPGAPATRQNIYTVVSCGEDQKSLKWADFRQGVFAYWLCQGLDGAADVDGDATVSMDELFRFLEFEVPLSAAYLRARKPAIGEQKPQRYMLGSNHADLKMFPLHPEPARKTFERLTGVVDALIRNHLRGLGQSQSLPKISVLEFGSRADQRRELRGPLGSLGAIARDAVERGLVDRSSIVSEDDRGYQLVLADSLRTRMRDVNLDDVLAGKLKRNETPVDAMVLGTFVRIGHKSPHAGPDRLLFEVQILKLDSDVPTAIGRISTTMLIDDELWSLLGGSRDDRQPSEAVLDAEPDPGNSDSHLISPVLKTVSWNADTSRRHPLRDLQNCSLKISVFHGLPGAAKASVDWVFEDPRDKNLLAFGVRRGDELEIRLENPGDKWLSLIAMVDGHDVIGKKRTFPTESRYWLIPPRAKGVISQWLSDAAHIPAHSGQSEFQRIDGRKFLVTDPPASVNGQQGITDDLGEIRLLVYDTKEVPKSEISRTSSELPSVGIGEGTEQENTFPVYRDRSIDLSRSRATYVIHYVEQQALK